MSFEDLQNRLEQAQDDNASADNTNTGTEEETIDTSVTLEDQVAEDEAADQAEEQSANEEGEEKLSMKDRILGKIRNIMDGKKADDAEGNGTDETPGQEDEESEEDAGTEDNADGQTTEDNKPLFVDPRFVHVAKAYGWDESQIVQYAKEHDARDMVVLASEMEKTLDTGESQGGDERSEVDLISDEVLAKLGEDEENKPIIEDVVKPLLAHVKKLSNALDGVQNVQQEQDVQSQNQDMIRDYDYANEVFDKHASEFGMLGSTENLPRLSDGALDASDSAVQVRREVFTKAMQLRQVDPNATMKSAMDDAMCFFRGKYGKDVMEKQLLSKIKKASKKVMPKHRAKNTTPSYSTPRDRKRAVINKALEKHGTTMK